MIKFDVFLYKAVKTIFYYIIGMVKKVHYYYVGVTDAEQTLSIFSV